MGVDFMLCSSTASNVLAMGTAFACVEIGSV